MIDASSSSGSSFEDLHESIDERAREIDGGGRRAVLIVYDADDISRFGETEHGLQEICSVGTVDPRSTKHERVRILRS